MGDGNNPNPVWLFQINNAERKSFHFPTSRAEFSGLAEFRIGLDFRQRLPNCIEKIFSEKFPALLIKTRRFNHLIFCEPMISDGFHAISGGLSPSLRRRECL